MFEVRELALQMLRNELFIEYQLIKDAFKLYEEIVFSFPATSDFDIIITKIIIKTQFHFRSMVSLILDGFGQEAGAILRLIIEASELIKYLEKDPTRVQKVIDGNLPSYGNIAKANGSDLTREVKNYLNVVSSHFNIDNENMKHLYKEINDDYYLNLKPVFDPMGIKENVESLLVMLSYNLDLVASCLNLEDNNEFGSRVKLFGKKVTNLVSKNI